MLCAPLKRGKKKGVLRPEKATTTTTNIYINES
jgi:hypothetical protein